MARTDTAGRWGQLQPRRRIACSVPPVRPCNGARRTHTRAAGRRTAGRRGTIAPTRPTSAAARAGTRWLDFSGDEKHKGSPTVIPPGTWTLCAGSRRSLGSLRVQFGMFFLSLPLSLPALFGAECVPPHSLYFSAPAFLLTGCAAFSKLFAKSPCCAAPVTTLGSGEAKCDGLGAWPIVVCSTQVWVCARVGGVNGWGGEV